MQLRRHLSPQGCRFKQCTTPTLSARARAEITPSVHWNIHTVHGNHRACMGFGQCTPPLTVSRAIHAEEDGVKGYLVLAHVARSELQRVDSACARCVRISACFHRHTGSKIRVSERFKVSGPAAASCSTMVSVIVMACKIRHHPSL